MAMETNVNGVTNSFEQPKPVKVSESTRAVSTPSSTVQPVADMEIELTDNFSGDGREKEPSKSTIEAAISGLNAKMAATSKTRCAYSYDEATKRVSIKVFDDETDEVIREIPPEKSLEALKKVWELAGLIVDKKG